MTRRRLLAAMQDCAGLPVAEPLRHGRPAPRYMAYADGEVIMLFRHEVEALSPGCLDALADDTGWAD